MHAAYAACTQAGGVKYRLTYLYLAVERCTCLEGSSRLGLIGDSLEGYIAAAGFIDNSSSLLPTIDLVPIISGGLAKIECDPASDRSFVILLASSRPLLF